MRTDLTPHITIGQYAKLTQALSKSSYPECQLKYLGDIIRLFKKVIREDLNMEMEMIARFPFAWNSTQGFWDQWAIDSCRATSETLENRLIWVEGAWCGVGLHAQVFQPSSQSTQWQVVVMDDDDWLMNSRLFDDKDTAIRFLDIIQWINDLPTMNLVLGGDP